MEKQVFDFGVNTTRRHFLSKLSLGVGSAALGSLLIPDIFKGTGGGDMNDFVAGLPHFAPKAKRVIYLFQNGAPSQI